ncbi:MAG: extracellular solute-binding protein, partial [Vallitaleaceae bacterium]|nr:extracellular solute-binding protein [Vallitaleaceae bacterium]
DETGNTKLDTALLSGEQIDLYFTYSVDGLKKRVEGGMMEPLASYGVEDFAKENIVGGLDGLVTINDALYALPTAKEPVAMMLNKNMLDALNITIPENWTVEQFSEIAKQLTAEVDGKKVYGTSVYYAGLPLDFAGPVLGGDSKYNAEGTASNFDAPEFVANASVKALIDNGSALPYEELITRKLETYAHPAFLAGEVGMMAFSAWMLRYVKDLENFPHDFVATFAPIPTTAEGVKNPYQAALNNHLCMNSNTEYKDQAWQFMQYWITEGSKYMYTAGKIPAWNKADLEEATKGILGENPEKLFDVAAYKKVMLNPEVLPIVDTITVAYPQMMQIYKEESEMYFLNVTTQEEYLANLKERCDAIIKEELGQ